MSNQTNPNISERRIQILSMIASGHSNKLVADKLNITESYVEKELREMRSLFECKNSTHLIVVCIQKGIIQVTAENIHNSGKIEK